MKKSVFHIILTFILTFAVTEYVWIELLGKDQIVAELKTEKESGTEEELREGRNSETQPNELDTDFIASEAFHINNPIKAFTAKCKSLRSIVKRNSPKLFLLYQQFRIYC